MNNSKYPISISRQCQLLHVGRSSYYYQPQGETDFNQQLMNDLLLPWNYIATAQAVQQEEELSLEIVLTEEGVNYVLEQTKGWRKAFVKSNLEAKMITFEQTMYQGPLEEIIVFISLRCLIK